MSGALASVGTIGMLGLRRPRHWPPTRLGCKAGPWQIVGNAASDKLAVRLVDLAARGEADTITVGGLASTALKAATVDLSGTGGTGHEQPDTVIANGAPGADNVHVNRSGTAVQLTGFRVKPRSLEAMARATRCA